MEQISNKSCFLRMKEKLADNGKLLLIDKNGSYSRKEAYDIYSSLLNELSRFINKGDVCLIAPFVKKETIIIVAAVVSLGGVVLVGNPQLSLEDYLNSIKDKTDVNLFIGFQDEKWVVTKDNKDYLLSLTPQKLIKEPSLIAETDYPSFYILTSGSTGKSTLVALSEFSFINHIIREIDDIGQDHTCSYGCLPLNHIFGLALYLQHLIAGRVVYISDSRNPDLALDMIEKYRCSAIGNVPTFFHMLIEAQHKKQRDISSLKYGVLAGGGYTKEQFLNIEKELGISLCSSYGMTEASTVITNSPSAWPIEERCIGVGKPFPGVEVIFKDDDGNVVPDEGEICFKGYNLMLGYVEKGKLVLPIDNEGYFHTGDIGMKDNKGVYHIVDRKKNIIIRGGENLSPYTIEKKIILIDGIKDVVVVGVPNEKYGEVVAAYIASDVYKNTEEVEELLKKALPKNEVPYILIIDDNIPLLSNGKHDRMRIRNIFISKNAHK